MMPTKMRATSKGDERDDESNDEADFHEALAEEEIKLQPTNLAKGSKAEKRCPRAMIGGSISSAYGICLGYASMTQTPIILDSRDWETGRHEISERFLEGSTHIQR